MVEGNSLENCRARKGTVSSNPTASALMIETVEKFNILERWLSGSNASK